MDKTCSICLDTIEDESSLYKLMPCQHDFHADCIVNWFRKKEDACPSCRDKPLATTTQEISENQYYEDFLAALNYIENFTPKYKDFSYVSAQARRKDASKKLQKLYGTYKKYKAKYDDSCRAVKEFRTETGTFHELRKRSRQLRHVNRLWFRNMNSVKRQMCTLFPNE